MKYINQYLTEKLVINKDIKESISPYQLINNIISFVLPKHKVEDNIKKWLGNIDNINDLEIYTLENKKFSIKPLKNILNDIEFTDIFSNETEYYNIYPENYNPATYGSSIGSDKIILEIAQIAMEIEGYKDGNRFRIFFIKK